MTSDNENHEASGVGELLSRFRAGEEDAATALYMRYARQIQSIAENETDEKMAVRVDPEGVVQSVFRTFFRRVNLGQYDVSDPDELWKLLLVIALNKLRSVAKSHRTAKRDVSKTVPLGESDKAIDKNQQALSVLEMTIQEIVSELPEGEGKIIMLRIEGFEVQEIADRCQRSKRSVERILQKFRMRLANEIQK